MGKRKAKKQAPEPTTFDRLEAAAERLWGPRGPSLADEVAAKIFADSGEPDPAPDDGQDLSTVASNDDTAEGEA